MALESFAGGCHRIAGLHRHDEPVMKHRGPREVFVAGHAIYRQGDPVTAPERLRSAVA